MKWISRVVVLSVVALFFVVPFSVVDAQAVFPGDQGYSGLVTCGDLAAGEPPCQVCHIENLIQELLRLAVFVAVFLATLLIAYAGFKMITAQGDPGKISEGKSILLKAVIGLVVVLGAWLIVDTLMKTFLDRGEFGPWNDLGECIEQPGDTTLEPPAGDIIVGTPRPAAQGTLSHEDAYGQLQSAGIGITSTTGADGVQSSCSSSSGCTTLNGIRADTIEQLRLIKQSCSTCSMTVTGATEPGHASGGFSHAAGYKIDLDDTPSLNSYFENTLTRDGVRGGDHGGVRYTDSCGNEYVRESNHWDITVRQPCAI